MSDDRLKLEYTDTHFYLCLGDNEIELAKPEAEALFVALGRALQDIGEDDGDE